jgi:hypothetical protein
VRTAHRQLLQTYFKKRRLPRGILEGVCRELHIDKAQSNFSLLQAAVAHLVLGGTHRRLRQVTVAPEGTNRRISGRRVGARPKFLFSVEWTQMSLGLTSYFATAVPPYGRVVVTASTERPDLFGYFDVALGHFSGDGELFDCAGAVIVEHWSSLARHRQERWGRFCEGGVINETLANRWADVVWSVSKAG